MLQGILELLETSPGLFRGLVFVFGLLLGSFATCMVWRVPRRISWFGLGGQGARSLCPSCGHVLSLPDLIPFFSWAFMHGKCRHCAAPVPFAYPAVELLTALLALGIAVVGGVSSDTLFALVMLPFVVTGVAIPLQNKGAVSLQPLLIALAIEALWGLCAFG